MKTFEKPLSQEEEKEYFERLKTGDLKAKEMLVLRNMRLVAHIAKKYTNNDRDTEDMISVGTVGLIKAVNTFDYSKGSRFSTYAAKCIDNEILMMLRAEKKTTREVSIYEPIGKDREGNEINLMDVIISDNAEFDVTLCLKENIKSLYRGLDTVLTPRERRILIMRYGLLDNREYTQNDIARMEKISRSYVSRIEKKALEKLLHFFRMCDRFANID